MPLNVVAHDLERGRLAQASGTQANIPVEIRVYRPRARQSPAAEALWVAVAP